MRGDGRVFRRGGTWWVGYYLRGKQYRESAHTPDEQKARGFLKQRMKQVGADQLGYHTFVGPQQQRLMVSELLNNLEADRKLRGIDSPQFKSHLRHVRERFGDMRALDVTAAKVDEFIENQLASGYRPATINRSTQLLGQSFKRAVTDNLLTSAPRIRRLSEKDNARQGFFSAQEFRAVKENLPYYLQDFALFGYLVGWRKGEIASLLWSDVQSDVIRLRGEHSKNGEPRMIVLEGELAELIERRRLARTVKTIDSVVLASLVFHHKGSPIVDTRKAWRTACCMAGTGKLVCPTCEVAVDGEHKCAKCSKSWKRDDLKYVGPIFHDLRRTCVRDLIRAGVPEKVAMTVSGHKTHSMLSRYNIVSETDLRLAMRRTQEYHTTETAASDQSVRSTAVQ
jgi:integrase